MRRKHVVVSRSGEKEMKKIIMIAFLSTLLIGCTTVEYKYKYIEVEVVVAAEVTPPPKFKKASLPIESLSDKDKKDYPKIAKSYVSSIEILKKEVEKRDTALNAYRSTKKDEKKVKNK